ncbi:MAG: hypothetical protein HY592_05090 [Candidatus Omnitrophica bacterium]|nr:hypothetical protein [Candidatus Omnitrophota bacterium]
MIRTMVYLPEALHKSIKHLAVERGTSIAKLVTEALETLYQEDIEDLRVGHERLQSYQAQPAKSTSYASYRTKRLKR